MKPILFDSTEKSFNHNGIGILSDAISCIVKAELNGQYELTLQYPVSGLHRKGLCMRNIILAKADPVSDLQPFRIYKISKPMNRVITVNARHIVYDLSGTAVIPFSAVNAQKALAGMSTNAVSGCDFAFFTHLETEAVFDVAKPATVWSLLGGTKGSVLDVYGGEYEYDRWNVILHGRRGMDRGMHIRYGKNLTSLEQDENCADCYTGVLPFWVDRESGAVTMLKNKIVQAEGVFNYVKIYPLDLSGDFEKKPTEKELTSAAVDYMKEKALCEPVVGWKVEYVALEQTEEYKGMAILERVLLGDTVHVDFADMEISVSARAIASEYDSLLERHNSVTLGQYKQTITDTIVRQGKSLASIPSASQLQQTAQRAAQQTAQVTAQQTANNLLGAGGGAIRLLDTDGDGMPDTLFVADNPSPDLAKRVLRLNRDGWSVSESGYSGPFKLLDSFTTGLAFQYAKDLDTGEGVAGYAVGWKTIDGVPYLVGYTEQ